MCEADSYPYSPCLARVDCRWNSLHPYGIDISASASTDTVTMPQPCLQANFGIDRPLPSSSFLLPCRKILFSLRVAFLSSSPTCQSNRLWEVVIGYPQAPGHSSQLIKVVMKDQVRKEHLYDVRRDESPWTVRTSPSALNFTNSLRNQLTKHVFPGYQRLGTSD